MAKRILFLIIIPFALFMQTYAGELELIEGKIKAHTEVFGDSTINPGTNKITVSLNNNKSIESMSGIIKINAGDLISDNKDRDEHMYETLEAKRFPSISFILEKIVKEQNGYTLKGILNLHGVSKPLSVQANIKESENNVINISSEFTIKMSDFKIDPPVLLFLTVRDEVDIFVDMKLKGE